MLNKERGEIIGDLGRGFRIVPNEKWRDTMLWTQAAKFAVAAFVKSGALLPIHFDDDHVLVQEYPIDSKIAFIFERKVAGKEMLYPYVFSLSPKAIAELRVSGRWPAEGKA